MSHRHAQHTHATELQRCTNVKPSITQSHTPQPHGPADDPATQLRALLEHQIITAFREHAAPQDDQHRTAALEYAALAAITTAITHAQTHGISPQVAIDTATSAIAALRDRLDGLHAQP